MGYPSAALPLRQELALAIGTRTPTHPMGAHLDQPARVQRDPRRTRRAPAPERGQCVAPAVGL
jgi:hypothetical protein